MSLNEWQQAQYNAPTTARNEDLIQPVLFRDNTKQKKYVPSIDISKLVISEYNPRRTRTEEQIKKLADRIERNGYEITRALWAYPVNGHYEVFAGGTRLEAVKRTTLTAVPVVVHMGYNDEEITRLADEDNENDEYHEPVSVVDVWLDYKKLADKGWTQERIAQAKTVSQATVGYRLLYANFPTEIHRKFITNDFLKEGHAREIIALSQCDNLTPWLDRESAMCEIIDAVLKRTLQPTAKQFADEVEKVNGVIALAKECNAKLDETWQKRFIELLAQKKARNLAQVDSCYKVASVEQAAEAARIARQKEHESEAARIEEEKKTREARLVEMRSHFLARLVRGDSRKVFVPQDIKLLFTDPPYGKNFQSNRRTVLNQADKIENDDDAAFDLLADVLKRFYPIMADDSFALVWLDWRYQCQFEDIITNAGFEIRAEVVWNKPNHGSGDIYGAPSPKHEKFFFAVKGNPKLVEGKRFDSVLSGSKFLGTEHPTEKPTDLIATVIDATTVDGDLVADPFMGSGSVPITAYKMHREFWGCDISEQWHKAASDILFKLIKVQ